MLTRLFVCGYKSMRMLKAISIPLLSKNNTYNIVKVVFCFRERNTRSLKKATNSRAWSMMLADIVMLEYICYCYCYCPQYEYTHCVTGWLSWCVVHYHTHLP